MSSFVVSHYCSHHKWRGQRGWDALAQAIVLLDDDWIKPIHPGSRLKVALSEFPSYTVLDVLRKRF
jgi:hypothetical protein